MDATTPVEVGTRGTIGSLVKKEIDYFRKMEIDYSCGASSIDRQEASSRDRGSAHWLSMSFLSFTWRIKRMMRGKGGNNGGIRPAGAGVCSMVEVDGGGGSRHSHLVNEVSGFNYVNLRVDSERFDHS